MSSPIQIRLRPATSAASTPVPGWAPVLSVITDGERRVLQVIDWTGGVGSKPTVGLYIGVNGLVTTAAAAVDVRGPEGADISVTAKDAVLLRNPTTGTVFRLELVGSSDDSTEPKWTKVA